MLNAVTNANVVVLQPNLGRVQQTQAHIHTCEALSIPVSDNNSGNN